MERVFLGLFVACAVIDWIAVARDWRRVEYVAKPLTLLALMGYAATGSSPSAWLMAALAFSLVGDVCLMLPADLFAAGLLAFLLGHIAYVVDFDVPARERLVWFLVTVIVASPVVVRIVRSVGDSMLRSAVGLYIGVISLMVASALALGDLRAVIGAVLFFASDGILAWNRFVRQFRWARPAIMITYHLGQLGLAAALRSR